MGFIVIIRVTSLFLATQTQILVNQKSIAVLPLDNLSSDPENEYLSDGITEDIIYALAKVDGLKVTARTSSFAFKRKKEDVRIIGNKLGVSTVLEGSIRKAGNRIRIRVQLIRTDNGFLLWSESFDRELNDIFSLQDEISLLVSDRIREEFGHLTIVDQLVKAPTDNIESYELYLKGRYWLKKWNLQDIEKGAHYFQESIQADPAFELPYFGAGLCHSLLGSWGGKPKTPSFQLAEHYFELGSEINKESVYAYHCLATHAFWGLWKDQEAIELLESALAIDAHNSEITECMAEVLLARGEFDEAMAYIQRSLDTDPLSPNHHYTKANIFYHEGEYDEARETCNRALEIDDSFSLAQHLWLACSALLKDKSSLLDVRYYPDELPAEVTLMLYNALYEEEPVDKEQAMAMVKTIASQSPRILMPWDLFLLVQIAPQEAMLSLIEKAEERMGQLVYFKYKELLAPLRELPEFQTLSSSYFSSTTKKIPDPKPEPVKKEILSTEETELYLGKLEHQMVQEEVYLDSNLNLRSLAEKIDVHPNKLSHLLNEKKGQNFNDYINNHRLKAFQNRALDPGNSHLTLLGLAYESGFTSKSVFNDFFKKSTGLTPKAWVKAHQK